MRKIACLLSLAVLFGQPLSLVGQTNGQTNAQTNGLTRGGDVRLRVEARAGDPAEEETLIYENSYALLVGNSRYKNHVAWGDLPGVVEDIEAVRKVLEEQHGFKVEVALNQSRDSLLKLLNQFVSKYGQRKKNRLLFYYSGHGYTALHGERKMGYLVMPDAPAMPDAVSAVRVPPSPEEFERFLPSAVNMAEIEAVAEKLIQSDHALFVFDSCFSGTAIYRSPGVKVSARITTEELKPVRAYLTAGNEEQSVPDFSRFRRKFVAGLMGEADTNGDGYIPGYELWRWVSLEVETETGRKQTPVYGKSMDDAMRRGDVIFASPKGATTPSYVVRAPELTTAEATAASPPAGLDIVTAQSILDRAIQLRDGSKQGQVEALETLLARGHEFSNSDLSGVSFRGAKLAKGVFRRSRMHGIDLGGADARGADFAETGLRFANLEGGLFAGALLTDSYAPFLWGVKADFEKADLSKANFFSANLRGANFSNADLRGTSFAFADLRGAKFDGADLTGAYLLGAVLDEATFVDATVQDTEFTGAVADKFLLSQKQKGGACRHDSYHGWNISLYERGNSRDSFAYVSEWFPNFTDRSLPLCTSEPLDSYYNTAQDNIQNAIYLEGVTVSKAGRREAFRARMKAHVAFLKENLTLERILKGDDAQRKNWGLTLRNAVKNTSPVSKPYLNTDLMLVALLREGVLDADGLDWEELAKNQHEYEGRFNKNPQWDFSAYSMWPRIFPTGVSWDDLPADKAAIYRTWTASRSVKLSDPLLVKRSIVWPEEKQDGPLPVWLTIIGGDRDSSGFEAKEKGVAAGHALSAPFDFSNWKLKRPVSVLYVLPQKLARYKIELPESFKAQQGLVLEVELKVEKIDSIRQKSSGEEGLTVLVFVTPRNVRLLKDGKAVWSGKFNVDTAAVEA